MTTTIDAVNDRDYWILEHSSRCYRPGCESDAMWVRHDAYTMPSEQHAVLHAAQIESEWSVPAGWVADHRFSVRRVASPTAIGGAE